MNNENYEHCKHIAETIEQYVNGDSYKCPHCEEVHPFPDFEAGEHENESGDICYICPSCSEKIAESDLEGVSIYDFFDTDIYDIEYRIGSDRQYRSVKIMVACGGPNIYIDTKAKAVQLYWWNESAEYPLSYEACNNIDSYFEELFYM